MSTPQRRNQLSSGPNILWICTDQQRYDTVGRLGNPYVSTPNIDNLVDEGVAFTHAFCQSPICTPSRASYMTVMYPSSVHVNGNGNGFFLDTFPLVTRSLVESGYDCGVIPNLRLASAHRRIDTCANGEYRYCQSSHTRRDDWTHGHDYANWLRQKGYILRQFTRDAEGMPPEVHETTWCVEKTIWNSRRTVSYTHLTLPTSDLV